VIDKYLTTAYDARVTEADHAAAFNFQVESFLNAVERGSWRRGYPTNEYRARSKDPELRLLTNSSIELGEETAAKVITLHQEQSPL
jgi:hypothetical protein